MRTRAPKRVAIRDETRKPEISQVAIHAEASRRNSLVAAAKRRRCAVDEVICRARSCPGKRGVDRRGQKPASGTELNDCGGGRRKRPELLEVPRDTRLLRPMLRAFRVTLRPRSATDVLGERRWREHFKRRKAQRVSVPHLACCTAELAHRVYCVE